MLPGQKAWSSQVAPTAMDLHIIDHPCAGAALDSLFGPQAAQQLGPLGQLRGALGGVIGLAEG